MFLNKKEIIKKMLVNNVDPTKYKVEPNSLEIVTSDKNACHTYLKSDNETVFYHVIKLNNTLADFLYYIEKECYITFHLKSTIARLGVCLVNAQIVGNLVVLTLKNLSKFSVTLPPELPIVQLMFKPISCTMETKYYPLTVNKNFTFTTHSENIYELDNTPQEVLKPKSFQLFTSNEFINIHDDEVGILRKCFINKEVIAHTGAGLFDTGFNGYAVFEVYNQSDRDILLSELTADFCIYKISKLSSDFLYKGNYQGQKEPEDILPKLISLGL